MKYWTEEAIKQHLDGQFFAVNVVSGQIETRKVPVNYIPTHKSSYQADSVSLSEKLRELRANPWLPEEEDRLIAMRERGVKWDSIRKILQRGEKGIKEHYAKLCQERGIELLMVSPVHAPALTPDAKREIVTLRKQGCSVAQVAEMTGRPAYQVHDYYMRYLAAKRLQEVP